MLNFPSIIKSKENLPFYAFIHCNVSVLHSRRGRVEITVALVHIPMFSCIDKLSVIIAPNLIKIPIWCYSCLLVYHICNLFSPCTLSTQCNAQYFIWAKITQQCHNSISNLSFSLTDNTVMYTRHSGIGLRGKRGRDNRQLRKYPRPW